MRPVVLVTTDRRDPVPRPDPPGRIRPPRPEAWLGEHYVDAVRRAGGLPLLVAPGETDIDGLLAVAAGVVLTGGHFDIHPSWYGEARAGRLDRVEEDRTRMELALAARCLGDDIPVLGVCGGMQVLAVAAGGTLIQDLPAPDGTDAGPLAHEQPTDPATPWHSVHVEAPATRWLPSRLEVNSTHHQAVRSPGAALVVCGRSGDGVVEVIASETHRFALGVQWHPELLGDWTPYAALVEASR